MSDFGLGYLSFLAFLICYLSRISCSLGGPQTLQVAEDDLEFSGPSVTACGGFGTTGMYHHTDLYGIRIKPRALCM